MRRTCLTLGLVLSLASLSQSSPPPRLFQTPRRPALPLVRNTAWIRSPVDSFILAKLEAKSLSPNRPADKLRLLRRVTFDLTGLPPSLEEQQAFLADSSPDAYEKVVSRLLASPHFGERQAQHWLDLVRYAESDGFNQDALRPHAYRYRDWVIQAFNDNLPYDQFVRWQLAGDELEPGNPHARIAVGFNRLWPDEYNAANLEQRRQEILDDNTDTTALVFLGLTFGCARCHDHKYDPISQKDYFRLQAFFASMQPRDLPAADAETLAHLATQQQQWEIKTAPVRAEMDQLVGKKRQALRDDTLLRFNADIQLAVRTAPEKRTPYQWQIALMAEKQLERGASMVEKKLSSPEKKRYQDLLKKLDSLGPPPSIPLAMTITDVGPVAPPTHRLIGGDWKKPASQVNPGFPDILGAGEVDTSLPPGVVSTGRRAALARWLTRSDHPLTARVLVNRLWQHLFGVGIVATSSDFGVQGTPPTHPELLDWLAVELVESGWDLKHLFRLLVTSATYRQDSEIHVRHPEHARGLAVDPQNDLLWHARRRRLEGEAIRDSILAISGELTPRLFGPSARPALPASFGKSAWKPDEDLREQNRRSIYVLAKRNLRFPLFDAFDYPDMHNSCSRRLSTTTAPQALILLNSEWALGCARQWAQKLRSHAEEGESLAGWAYQSVWGRPATPQEIALALRFIEQQSKLYRSEGSSEIESRERAFLDFCHALLNTNEFVYLD